ncbi:MAG: tail fiber domain-containing protein [Pseudonocardiaceae bacterium]
MGTSTQGVGVTAMSTSGTALHARRQDTGGAVIEARLATAAVAGDFSGDVKLSGVLAIGASGGSGPAGELRARPGGGLELRVADAADKIDLSRDGGSFATLSIAAERVVVRRDDGTPTLAFDSAAGNLGIGTTDPKTALHLPDRGLQIGASATAADNFHWTTDTVGGPRGLRLYRGDHGAGTHALTVLSGGSIGVGTASPQRRLHVEGTEIHSGGSVGGLSFANRNTASFVEQPSTTGGERWVWYAQGGIARLWSGRDRLSVSLTAEGGGLDVARRMRVRQEADSSAGIWFFQTAPQADRAFVGMADNTHVGFWGNTGANWGLSMDTSNGNLAIGTNNPIRVSSAWTGFPDAVTNQAEISNDTGSFQTLMIVGNQSAGLGRRVSVWDRLEVNGQCFAQRFLNLSDGRLKTDVAVLDTPLDRLAQLRGVSFRWQPDAAAAGVAGGLGVIAQDVAEVFPELISTVGPEQHLAVDYSGLTAVLLEAVKELKAENERLRRRVDTLEERGSTARDRAAVFDVTGAAAC